MTIPQVFDLAFQNHQAGRLADAEALYRQILAVQPKHAGALHLLGVIAHQVGRDDLAVEWIRRAIGLNPNDPAAHCNLGEAYRATGRLDEAIASYRRALALSPDYPEAHNNLGVALQNLSQLDKAVAAHRAALKLRPGFLEACNNLGAALAAQGKPDEAIAAYRRALALNPDHPASHFNLGNALRERDQLHEAIAAYRRALELKPTHPEAHNNLGVALQDLSQLDEARAAFRRAVELKPGYFEALNNLGSALRDQGELDEAIGAYRQALQWKPDYVRAHSNLILTLHLHPDHDTATISEERQRWNRQFSDPLKPFHLPHANHGDPKRRLRVGYVSPDFRDHPVGRYVLPLFENCDRERFDILCYSGVARSDEITERFRALAGTWRNTVGVSDSRLAEMIREDAVDILVDLALHTPENRLLVFARKPAPVQISFAGYPESSGVEAIEYRMSDRYLEPPPAREETGLPARQEIGGKEQVCLIDSFWCYDPRGIDVEPNPLPAIENGMVTFGCLGNFCKINERVLRLWARVLGKVKDSRLVLLADQGSHRQRTLNTLDREGVEARRVEFLEYRPRREYLELYHRLDIVLDTVPYNGHTTSVDALWMGVPVVTLVGETPVSRAGLSLLSNLGLPELAAPSEEHYARIAIELAADPPRLAALRAALRSRMQASPLMDAPRFAQNIEAAYRSLWERWCAALP